MLWGARPGQLSGMEAASTTADRQFLYRTEHAEALQRIFSRRYTAVVGNPPYIVCRDPALNRQYRDRYKSCHRQYSLGVPFTENFFDLAIPPDNLGQPAGYVGMITANSFMKREFGKKLIEKYIPSWDLTHVVDTSGVYIPGHGTPTVILFGRRQRPILPVIRIVMGIKGEPSTPPDPAKGLVWTAIVDQVDEAGSESEFVSVGDTDRTRFAYHPWSIGGGGASELKDRLDNASHHQLRDVLSDLGRTVHTGEDDAYLMPRAAAKTRQWQPAVLPLIEGEALRDYEDRAETLALFPYTTVGVALEEDALPITVARRFWLLRPNLRARLNFGATNEDRGLRWFEYSMFFSNRFRSSLSIAFAFVATHNHFVLDRGGKVFNRSAPVIKLPDGASVDEYLGLIGILNSSVACFWMKQVFFPKGGDQVGHEGARIRKTWWDERYEHDGTKLRQFPLPPTPPPLDLVRTLDGLATEVARHQPRSVTGGTTPTRTRLD
ncbi:MAG: BREX-2 system adenine-specific DNA-methyltransferase PglX, partial [Actinobacteria bacterium]|nr:BREX-2 system adenine-specific DNA-methyltransferase PglX [Actinomycetota bacterium]